MNSYAKLNLLLIQIGRRLFKNTKVQHFKITQFIHNALYRKIISSLPKEIEFRNLHFEVIREDASINPSIFDGSFENNEINWLLARCKKHISKINRQIIFIDVGANIGIYSILVASIKTDNLIRVYCFEPDIRNLNKLETNIKLNNLKNITVSNKAISSSNGFVNLYLEANSGTNYVTAESNSHTRLVPSTTLSEVFDIVDNISNATLILKIDVEGLEGSILNSAMKEIRILRPDILFEFSGVRKLQERSTNETVIDELYDIYDNMLVMNGQKILQNEEAINYLHSLENQTVNVILFN